MSKASVKSRKIAPVSLSFSGAVNTSLVNFSRAVVVEKLGLKPDWHGDRILKSVILIVINSD